MIERDGWTRERVLEHQQQRLRELIAHAREHSPYYREALRGDALPTLTKATLMEQWDRIVCDPRLRLAEVQAHVAGPDAGEPYLGEFHVFSTSGATGPARARSASARPADCTCPSASTPRSRAAAPTAPPCRR